MKSEHSGALPAEKNRDTQPDKPTEDYSSWGSFGGGTSQVNGFTVGADGFKICRKRNTKNGPNISVDRIGIAGLRIVRCLVNPSPAASHQYWPTIEFHRADGELKSLSVPLDALRQLKEIAELQAANAQSQKMLDEAGKTEKQQKVEIELLQKALKAHKERDDQQAYGKGYEKG